MTSQQTNKNYTIKVDELCQEHGGYNAAYQNDDENFVRLESVCEGCVSTRPHRSGNTPTPQPRPQRPLVR